ncbi:hypothetical protein ANCCAN_21049, partial [Ancylostoma caninum]
KGVLKIIARTCFHPGASTLVPMQLANVSVPFLYRDVVNFYNEKAPTFLRLTFDTVPNAILTAGVCLIIACE